MIAKKYTKTMSEGILASAGKRVSLVLLLIGQVYCGYLIWFYHNPGFQSWVALPALSGLATIWLLAGSDD
jgi:hypothetical protein